MSRDQVRKIERVVEAAEREPETFAPLVAVRASLTSELATGFVTFSA